MDEILKRLLIVSFLIFLSACECLASESRFIPIELWTGSKWDEIHKLKYGSADLTFGNGRKRITGPIVWRNPITEIGITGYHRVHLGSGKEQIFTITHDGQTLGRVYDSRRQRSIIGGAKFPLGWWRQEETRLFDSVETPLGKQKRRRRITIEILQINFSYNDIENCLKFRWTKEFPRNGQIIDDNNYTYCPDEGLVEVEDN